MQNNTTCDAFSIAKFCENYGISRALFYRLKKEGTAPHTFNLGRRVLISREAASAWLAKMEGPVA